MSKCDDYLKHTITLFCLDILFFRIRFVSDTWEDHITLL